jgi:hypothetical protein
MSHIFRVVWLLPHPVPQHHEIGSRRAHLGFVVHEVHIGDIAIGKDYQVNGLRTDEGNELRFRVDWNSFWVKSPR